TEHSGVQNLGIEGLMLIGALTAFWASVHLGTPWAGVIAAVVVAGGVGLVYASLTVSLGTDQVVTGLALNILAAGLTSYLGRALVGLPPRASFGSVPIPGLSHIPVLGPVFFHQTIFTYASYLMVPALTLALFHTRWGLHLRAVGESPGTADAAGLSVVGFRYAATILGAALVGGRAIGLRLGAPAALGQSWFRE